jgi:ketosteroid isomerase-like protein
LGSQLDRDIYQGEILVAPPNNQVREEAQIRQRVGSWAKVLRAKDVDGLLSHYAQEIVVFDLAPPLEFKGVVAYKKNWIEWFATFQGPVGYEIRDLNVTTAGDVEFCHSLNQITGTRTSGENSDAWVHATVGFRKIGGIWKITHEHFFVPFNMETLKAAIDLQAMTHGVIVGPNMTSSGADVRVPSSR